MVNDTQVKPSCVITVGPNASGKTTWALEQVDASLNSGKITVIICRYDIRRKYSEDILKKPFSWQTWKWKHEPTVTAIASDQIHDAISKRYNVIVADTNLVRSRVNSLKKMFEDNGYTASYKLFYCDWETLIKRDAARLNGVGASVIESQMHRFIDNWGEEVPELTQIMTARKSLAAIKDPLKCFIVDVDGTLATHANIRDHYDLTKVSLDKPVKSVFAMARGLISDGYHCFVFSGREGTRQCLTDTKKWLIDNFSLSEEDFNAHVEVYQRQKGDMRHDEIVKLELLQSVINLRYKPELAIDDRPRVCRMWRYVGIQAMQVSDPYIEF